MHAGDEAIYDDEVDVDWTHPAGLARAAPVILHKVAAGATASRLGLGLGPGSKLLLAHQPRPAG